MRKAINDAFPDTIVFFRNGKFVIVYGQHTNPCEYSVNTLKGSGLREDDIIRSFDLEKYGWRVVDGCFTPVWYTCPQLPKCLRKYNKSDYDADIEDPFLQPLSVEIIEPVVLIVGQAAPDPNEPPSKKVRRGKRLQTASNEDTYCADDECAPEVTSQQSDSSESDWDSSVIDSSDNTDPDWEY